MRPCRCELRRSICVRAWDACGEDLNATPASFPRMRGGIWLRRAENSKPQPCGSKNAARFSCSNADMRLRMTRMAASCDRWSRLPQATKLRYGWRAARLRRRSRRRKKSSKCRRLVSNESILLRADEARDRKIVEMRYVGAEAPTP